MHLVLYISGSSARSQLAEQHARRLCGESLGGQATLEVVDLLEEPQRALEEGVRITPTLARLTARGGALGPRVFGDLDDPQAVLAALGLARVGAGT